MLFPLQNKVRVIKMLVVVAGLFAVSWAPYFVLLLIAVSSVLCYMADISLSVLNLCHTLMKYGIAILHGLQVCCFCSSLFRSNM